MSQTTSGPWSVGDADANSVRMPATAWVNQRWDVGQSASGRQLGCQHWLNGAANGVWNSVGWNRGRERRHDVGDGVGRV